MDSDAPTLGTEACKISANYKISPTSSTSKVMMSVLEAVADNDFDRFKSLLEASLDADPEGRSEDESDILALCLLEAAEKGHQEIAELLLEKTGVRVNERNSDGFTALDLASANGHLQIVEALLKYKGIEVWRPSGINLLHLAVQNGHLPVVEAILLKEGIRSIKYGYEFSGRIIDSSDHPYWAELLDNPDEEGLSPLHLAAKNGHSDIVRFLRSKGAKIAKDRDCNTSLHLAAREGHDEIVEDLVDTNVNYSDYYDVDYGSCDRDHKLCKPGVNWTNNCGKTPLHLASERGHDEVVRLLLGNQDINVNARRSGSTALHLATQGGHARIVKFLTEHKKIYNLRDNKGRTALGIAQRLGNSECIKILMKRFKR